MNHIKDWKFWGALYLNLRDNKEYDWADDLRMMMESVGYKLTIKKGKMGNETWIEEINKK